MTQVVGQVDRFGQPMPSEPGYCMFINEDGSQPRMRIRVHLDNSIVASDDPVTDATFLSVRGGVVPMQGLSIPDSNVSISIANGSEFTLPVATANRTIKLLVDGPPITNESVVFNVTRTGSQIITFTDDVDTVLFQVPGSIKMSVSFSFDGTHFGSAHAIRIE